MSEVNHQKFPLSQSGSGLGVVSEAGTISKTGGAMKVYRHLGSYAVVQLLNGSGWYEDERGYRAKLAKGDVLVIFPDVGHRYGPEEGERWEEFYMVFHGPIFDLWRHSGVLRSGLWKDIDGTLLHWGKRAMAAVVNYEKHALQLICEVQMSLAELRDHSQEDADIREKDVWCANAMKLLGNSDLDIQSVAKEVGMGYENFRKAFKKKVGMSPNRYRQKQLATRAWHLISGSKKPMYEIAEQLGFCDEYYFSRFFKKHFGTNPSELRR
ncbi:hypothetical protein NT6N_11280 [Oceaniferula spumae]|uniref:HTH araC/xylS-type domain-containing protein n=1 Tax=Oceaniferula spumae TaxID=2979115 RepID=A0AAT9FJF3_9BACT